MHICIDVSQVVYGTGVSRYTLHLTKNLLNLDTDHQFTLFGGSLRRAKELKLLLNRLPAKKSLPPLPPKLLNLLWNNLHLVPIETFTGPIDLLHTSDWAEPPTKKALKVTTIHDLAHFKNPQYASPHIRRIHRKKLFWVKKETTHIIAPSQATKKDIVNYLHIDPGKISVIYEATTLTPKDSSDQNQPLPASLPIKKPYILIPGCGHPRKNIARQIEAFKKADLPHQLVIFGHASQKERQLASQNVIFTGYVKQNHIASLYQNARLVLYASLYEGFGLPILDAFVSQTPVVTGNLSSLPEVAGSAAVLVDPKSTSNIQTGIIKAIENKQELIQKGLLQAQNFSWKKTAQKTLTVYQKVLQNHQ